MDVAHADAEGPEHTLTLAERPQWPSARARTAPVHGHCACSLGGTSPPGVPNLRPGLAGSGSARAAWLFLSVAGDVGGTALRLRARDVDWLVAAAAGFQRNARSPRVDDCARYSVFPPFRTPAAANPGDQRVLLL